jgi:hypothetical protein
VAGNRNVRGVTLLFDQVRQRDVFYRRDGSDWVRHAHSAGGDRQSGARQLRYTSRRVGASGGGVRADSAGAHSGRLAVAGRGARLATQRLYRAVSIYIGVSARRRRASHSAHPSRCNRTSAASSSKSISSSAAWKASSPMIDRSRKSINVTRCARTAIV